MRKVTDKLIAIVLAMTLVMSMSSVAFADVNSSAVASSNERTVAAIDTDGKVKAKINDGKTKVMGGEFDTMTIKSMLTSASTEPLYDEWDLEQNMYGLAEVTATTTGYIWFDVIVEGENSTDCVDFMLFENVDDDYGYELGRLRPGEYSMEESGFYAVKGQSYYFYFVTPTTNKGTVTVSARAKMYCNVSYRTLPVYANANQYLWSSRYDKSGQALSTLVYKVVPNKTGLMTVDLKAYTNRATTAKVTLYSANRSTALSSIVSYNSSQAATKAYFGVTKGKTYYIRVQNCMDKEGYGAAKYGIKYSITAATDRNLSTTSKALTLTKGATAKSTLLTANNATGTDIYKIYVPKTQVAKFTVNTQKIRSGNVAVRVYKNGKQVGRTQILYPNNTSGTYTITYGTSSGKASKGTYYIKVVKGAKTSGLYTIRYNK